MLQLKLDKNLVWILIAVLCCCSTGIARGEDSSGPDPDASSSPNPVSPPVVMPSPAQSSSPALRDAKYYLQSTYSFRNVLEAGFIAGVPNLTAAPVQPQPPAVIDEATATAYEGAMDQYSADVDDWRRSNEAELRYRGRRFGFGLATAETRDLLSNFVLPVALQQDPRYVSPSLGLSTGSRLGFAAESVFVTRDNAGRRVPNFSKLAGTAGAALIARYLYADRLGVPTLNSSQFLWRYMGYSLAGDAATNVARELLRTAVRQDLIRNDEEGSVTDDNYYPLSTAGTLLFWARSTVAPRNFISGALIAGLPNILTEPTYPAPPTSDTKAGELAYADAVMQYGTAMEDWRRTTDEEVRYRGRRFIGGFSESETQQFLGNCLIPITLRMDPRYIPAGGNYSVGARLENAIEQIAVSRTNSGARMINLPLLGGTFGAAFIAQQLYYDQLGVPELASNRLVGKTIGFNLAGDLLLNIVHEFSSHQGT
jgi:hypothetical protein